MCGVPSPTTVRGRGATEDICKVPNGNKTRRRQLDEDNEMTTTR